MKKTQLCRLIRDKMRQEFKKMYSSAEAAFGALDFRGNGYVTEEQFLNCLIVNEKIPYSKEQIQVFLQDYNLFPCHANGLEFDSFKKNFFPQLYLV